MFKYSFKANAPKNLSLRCPVWSCKKLKADKKLRHYCIGGPFDGQKLYLTDGSTMVFHCRGFFGRYVCALVGSTTEWKEKGDA